MEPYLDYYSLCCINDYLYNMDHINFVKVMNDYGYNMKINHKKVDWKKISIENALSEDFIKEFKDKVEWEYISVCQTLSEDFIREFEDKVDWECISECQILSEPFIREFRLFINFKLLEINEEIICFSQSFMDDFKGEFSPTFYNENEENLSKICMLQRYIIEFLYVPGGRMYLKTKQYFEAML